MVRSNDIKAFMTSLCKRMNEDANGDLDVRGEVIRSDNPYIVYLGGNGGDYQDTEFADLYVIGMWLAIIEVNDHYEVVDLTEYAEAHGYSFKRLMENLINGFDESDYYDFE